MDQLFVNGKRKRRARYPSYDPEDPTAKGKGVVVCPEDVLSAIVSFYHIQGGMWGSEVKVPKETLYKLTQRAKAQLASDSARRRAIGLLLLCRVKREEGEAEAQRILAAPAATGEKDADLRNTATEILLHIGGKKHLPLALETLSSPNEKLRVTALGVFLKKYASVHSSVRVHVGDKVVWASYLAARDDYISWRYDTPKKEWQPPKLPAELKADALRPLLEEDDLTFRAGTGYLLVLLGASRDLTTLLEAWRAEQYSDDARLMLARAIAVLGDDENVKYLKEMLNELKGYERESWGPKLYWTMRRMKGTEARGLRRSLRKEFGVKLIR